MAEAQPHLSRVQARTRNHIAGQAAGSRRQGIPRGRQLSAKPRACRQQRGRPIGRQFCHLRRDFIGWIRGPAGWQRQGGSLGARWQRRGCVWGLVVWRVCEDGNRGGQQVGCENLCDQLIWLTILSCLSASVAISSDLLQPLRPGRSSVEPNAKQRRISTIAAIALQTSGCPTTARKHIMASRRPPVPKARIGRSADHGGAIQVRGQEIHGSFAAARGNSHSLHL